ncbi:conserved protein of unknown function [Bradyrhizobium vignae]|uniref:Uncharacterized protein n=1 Tax=Bradyrhizobium vignae TaxID=1549949 RepID=A0A2U3Q535_9BRAD|nr:conserved protein of unknown function [Bradyrhizobium vignae]
MGVREGLDAWTGRQEGVGPPCLDLAVLMLLTQIMALGRRTWRARRVVRRDWASRYLIAELTRLNLLFNSAPPVLFTATTIASAIPAAIRLYSMAVAPFSSARKDLSKRIANSCSSDRTDGRLVSELANRSSKSCAHQKN